jgi:hypothetical protein
VDTEWKMHPDRFMEIIMMCVGKYLKTEAGTYIRMLNTQQQFAFARATAGHRIYLRGQLLSDPH